MGCGEDCTGAVDLTGLLAGLPPDEWRTVRVRLRCFAEKGADMARIDAPLHLSTGGSFALGLASVRLLPATEGAADCP
jgi:beta-glucosidase